MANRPGRSSDTRDGSVLEEVLAAERAAEAALDAARREAREALEAARAAAQAIERNTDQRIEAVRAAYSRETQKCADAIVERAREALAARGPLPETATADADAAAAIARRLLGIEDALGDAAP